MKLKEEIKHGERSSEWIGEYEDGDGRGEGRRDVECREIKEGGGGDSLQDTRRQERVRKDV